MGRDRDDEPGAEKIWIPGEPAAVIHVTGMADHARPAWRAGAADTGSSGGRAQPAGPLVEP